MSFPSTSSKVDTIDISTSRSAQNSVLALIREGAKNTTDLEATVNSHAQEFYARLIEDALPLNIAFSDILKAVVKETETTYEIVHALTGVHHHKFPGEMIETSIDVSGLVFNKVRDSLNEIPGVNCSINECSVEKGLETTKFNAFVITIQKGLTLKEGESPASNLGAYILQEASKYRSQYDSTVDNLVKRYVEMLITCHFPVLVAHTSMYPLLVKEEEDRYIFFQQMAAATNDKPSPFTIKFTKKDSEDSEPRSIGILDATKRVYDLVCEHFNALPDATCEIITTTQGDVPTSSLKITIMK